MIGQKSQNAIAFGVKEFNATQRQRVVHLGVFAAHEDMRVAQDCRLIDRAIAHHFVLQLVHGTDDEEGRSVGESDQAREVDVAAIHHIETARFQRKIVQKRGIGHKRWRDAHDGGYAAAQIQHGVQLDARLGIGGRGPLEQSQAQLDGAGIDGIDRLLQLQGQAVVAVQSSRHIESMQLKSSKMRQSRRSFASARVEREILPWIPAWYSLPAWLRRHAVISRKPSREAQTSCTAAGPNAEKTQRCVRASVARHASIKNRSRQVLLQLREHQLAFEHDHTPANHCECAIQAIRNSNRLRHQSVFNSIKSMAYCSK